jgi:hypothetical protein
MESYEPALLLAFPNSDPQCGMRKVGLNGRFFVQQRFNQESTLVDDKLVTKSIPVASSAKDQHVLFEHEFQVINIKARKIKTKCNIGIYLWA